jgi:hypothetical protein
MRLQKLATLALALLFSSLAAAVDHVQINFYSDKDCSQYEGEVQVGWASDLMHPEQTNSFNYRYGTSMNIAGCAHDYCMCLFYPEENSNGGPNNDVWSVSLILDNTML